MYFGVMILSNKRAPFSFGVLKLAIFFRFSIKKTVIFFSYSYLKWYMIYSSRRRSDARAVNLAVKCRIFRFDSAFSCNPTLTIDEGWKWSQSKMDKGLPYHPRFVCDITAGSCLYTPPPTQWQRTSNINYFLITSQQLNKLFDNYVIVISSVAVNY